MATPTLSSHLDIDRVRADFPVLHQEVNKHPLVYFDNAATGQKPKVVIDRISDYYRTENANVHRGVHTLSQRATDAFEHTREVVRAMLNAQHKREIIYTKGTTDGINLVAQSYARPLLKPGDEIIISAMEHHSNIVPWQLLCAQTGAILKIIPMDERGVLDIQEFGNLLSERTKMVSVVYISNSLGTINPVADIIQKAHSAGAAVLIDGAQAVPHQAVDVQALDCDFFVFSGHKTFGPTGSGILYGKEALLEAMPPYQGGGDMIDVVRFDQTTYAGLPSKFEAGTPNIAGMIGLGAALEYIQSIGYEAIAAWEAALLQYATERLATLPGIRFIGTAPEKASVVSFLIGDIHPYDAGTILDQLGIAIRTGHHCTQPVMHQYGIPGTMRASFAFYNTREEIDMMMAAIERAMGMLG